MTNCGKDILSAREGSGQMQRFIKALDPESVQLNDFNLKEWMTFAYRFARHINYFDPVDAVNPSGNWEGFFIPDSELDDFLQLADDGENLNPHLALFVSFIRLLEFSKNRFNKLTKRHLDFYYRRILKIEKLPATPDKVHLIFELARNVADEKISRETALDGGKDSLGKKRIYKTTGELVANKSRVAQLKNVYTDHVHKKMKAANKADSYDGNDAAFPNDEVKWWPFGHYGDAAYPELADAKTGFALASTILELQEGMRNVQITVDFASSPDAVPFQALQDHIAIYCSGEKGWLGPFQVLPQVEDESGNVLFTSSMNSGQKKLKIAFQLPKEEGALVGYQPDTLGENFQTTKPVCRVLIKTGNEGGFDLYRNLVSHEIKKLTLNVHVRGIKSLALESDIGTLNAEKPFYPFSTQPVKRSNFYISYPELFKKSWKSLDVEIKWKNTPESTNASVDPFENLYYAYRTDYIFQANPSKFITAMFFKNVGDTLWQFNSKPDNLIVTSDAYFKAAVEILEKEDWQTVDPAKTLFTKASDGSYQTNFQVSNAGGEAGTKGPVRLSLNQSFLHELFPRIYALAFTSEEKDALIPNEPYTPMVDSISLNYEAEAGMNLGVKEEAYRQNPVSLFHEHPFGQSEEHPWLKSRLIFLTADDKKIKLLPAYCKGGELYIGLEQAENLQQVSLLVQVLEGSENPLAESFTGKQKAEWSVLCQNEWKSLDSNFMISNQTDNFLKSGIVQFSIPADATHDHTLLPAGLVWIKVKIHKNYDAVCKTIAILAQAVPAEFAPDGNDFLHLEKGLEAKTISKLVQRVATVKGVSQPFSSFGGAPEESDQAYYRRVSERLRHKNRAVALWDYEHIILQQFPEVHKVKCLNHSSETSFLSPGDVLIVVIPDIVNKNVFDIFQPRVSRATLNAIQNKINQLNTLHVNAKVINPDYEEITVSLKVKFHTGYDENYYLKVLNEDITRLLSPWAFEETAAIEFGITLHRSVVINYIEKLTYVDYVEDVKLIKNGEISLARVAPSCPKAILVSARQHQLTTNIKSCATITETKETCQT
ncbi:baseplate J/gp47 family protein [Gaoshiqia sp. Z1-71]|uniref:baseplate J/gp47 family protein n=1 Tax=Gaoshiqia hydrogeniformans TaxID=3290090 RepID=UPI003BF82B53